MDNFSNWSGKLADHIRARNVATTQENPSSKGWQFFDDNYPVQDKWILITTSQKTFCVGIRTTHGLIDYDNRPISHVSVDRVLIKWRYIELPNR